MEEARYIVRTIDRSWAEIVAGSASLDHAYLMASWCLEEELGLRFRDWLRLESVPPLRPAELVAQPQSR